MVNENGIKTDKKPIRDEKGLFLEGTKSGPGRPEGSKNYLTLLEEALEEEAKKEDKTYWKKLAEWCFINPKVATAILKKFVPDKTHTEIETTEPVEIIIHRAKDES